MATQTEDLLSAKPAEASPEEAGSQTMRLLSGDQEASKLSYSLMTGAKIEPDKAAKVLNLAAKTGLPQDLIARDPDAIEQASKYADFDAKTFHHKSPITASWMAENPHQASIGGQDIAKLGWVEQGLKMIGATDMSDQYYRGRLSMQLSKIGEKAMLGTITPEDRDMQAQIEKRLAVPTDFGLKTFAGSIPGWVAGQAPFLTQSLLGKAKLAGAGAAAFGAAGAVKGAGEGLLFAGLGGPETPAVGAAIEGGAGVVTGGLLGWKYGAAVQDARIFGGLSYLDFEKMKDDSGQPLDRQTALGAATITGVVNGALGMIPLESILKNTPVLRALSQDGIKELLATPTTRQAFLSYAKNVGHATALGGGVGFTQAMVQSTAAELAKMGSDGSIYRLSPGAVLARIFSDQNMDAAMANAKMGMGAAGGTSAGLGLFAVHADLNRAKQGQAQSEAIKAVGDVVGQTKAFETSPAAVRGLLARVGANGGAPNLYAPVDTWNTYFQSKNVDPREVAREVVGDTKSYDEASRTGGDIQIPTHNYATTLGAIPEHNAFFANELRADPLQMNGREAAEFFKGIEKTAQAGEPSAADAQSQQIETRLAEQIKAAGFPAADADTYSKLGRAFGVLAQREGIEPDELFQKYGLNITREGGEAPVGETPASEGAASKESFFQSALDKVKGFLGQDAGAEKTQQPPEALNDSPRRETAYKPMPGLDQDQRTAETRLAQVLGTPEASERYAELPGTFGGKLLDVDAARYLSPDYAASNEARTRHTLSTQRPASHWIEDQYHKALAKPAEGPVLMMGGGGGSGKTTVLMGLVESTAAEPDVIFDSVLANKGKAVHRIEAALESGRGVHIAFVYRPVLDAAKGVAERFALVGRWVPPDILAHDHIDSQETLFALHELYKNDPRVAFQVFDNSGKPQEISVDALREKRYVKEGQSRAAVFDGIMSEITGVIQHAQEKAGQTLKPGDAAGNEPAQGGPVDGRGLGSEDSSGERTAADAVTYQQAARGDEPRAKITFGGRSVNIDLLRGADLSSLIHELGHFYFEVLGDLAQRAGATEQTKADYDRLLKFSGAESRDNIANEHHEKIAKAFEAYIMEGKAPTSELRSAFSRMRAWMVGVYQQIKNVGVELTPEVRGVFDRLLASEDEIKAAQREQKIEPLFADPRAMGMSEEDAVKYRQAIDEAQSAAEEQLSSKMIADFNRARKSWWKDVRGEARDNIEEEVNGRKEYIARAVLQTGKMPDGSELPEGMKPFKLDRKGVVDAYGEDMLKRLPRASFSREGGVSPQAAAEAFGFRTGEELVTALANTQNRRQLVDQLADEHMRQNYGDMMTDGSIGVEAMKAVHNEKRGQLLQKELEYLASEKLPALKEMIRKVTRRIPPIEAVRDNAEKTINEKPVRDIQPSLYQKAEYRAGQDAMAALLKGDFEGAFEAKQRELLNSELYRAASNARETVDKIVGYMSKFDKAAIREKLAKAGGDYLDQIDALLERYDFRKSISLKAIDQRKSLTAWVAEQQAKGYDISMPQRILDEAGLSHYKDTPVEELQGVRDAVGVIEHLAITKNKLLASQEARELQQVRDEALASMSAYFDMKPEKIDFAPGLKAQVFAKARGIMAAHTRMEFLFEHLDGEQPHGFMWETLFNPFNKSQDKENGLMRGSVAALNDIFSAYTRAERARWFLDKTHVSEIDNGTMTGYMNKANMLAVALNWGNLYNREALMRGYGWREAQVEAILKHLDARDWQTVGKLWKHIDSFWPEAERLEKDINGTAPEKVEAYPFDVHLPTGDLHLDGGYYPIVFDKALSWRQSALDERASVKEMFGGNWARAMTRHGHLIERDNTGGKPLLLELTGLTNHLSSVIHDISFRREVIDAHRIINDPQIREGIVNAAGKDMYKQLNPWLHAIAGDRLGEPMNPIEGLLGKARNGATIVNLGYSVTTALVHALGYHLAAKELGLEYAGKGLRDAWLEPWKINDKWSFITDRSEMMKFYPEEADRDIRDALRHLNAAGVSSGVGGAVDSYTMGLRHSFLSYITYMNLASAIPAWLGAYRKAMDGGIENINKGDEKAAAEYGDQVVRITKGMGTAKDMASIQRGSQAFKLFTMFYSQMTLQFNQFDKTYNQFRMDRSVPKLMGSLALAWFAPAVLDEVIRGRTPSTDDDEEKWTSWLARKEALYPFHSVILARDIAHTMDKYVETGKADFTGSPAFDVFSTAAKGVSIPFKAAAGKEIGREDYKDAFNTAGYGFGLPTHQTWKTGEYLYDWMTGEEQPANPVEGVWRAAVTGKKKK